MALETDLISYWKLDGDSTDEVGSNDGSDTDITYSEANGKIVQGAGFNGTTSKIVLDTPIARPINVSISVWIKCNIGANEWIIADIDAAGANGWGLRVNSDGKLYFMWANGGVGEAGQWETDSAVISNATWHHVVVTQVGADGTPIIYVDNVSKALSKIYGSGNTLPAAQGTAIGEYGAYTGGLQFFNGAIDEVGLWERVLNSTEVGQLYNSGNGLAYPFGNLQTASFSAIPITLTIPAITSSFLSVATAVFNSISLLASVPATTASNLCEKIASYVQVSLLITSPAITATYESELDATFTPISFVLTIPDITATYDSGVESAEFTPVSLVFTIPAITASWKGWVFGTKHTTTFTDETKHTTTMTNQNKSSAPT